MPFSKLITAITDEKRREQTNEKKRNPTWRQYLM